MEKVFNLFSLRSPFIKMLQLKHEWEMGDGVDLVNQHIQLFMDRMVLFETPGGIFSVEGGSIL
jgi:hypothetical protein